MSLWKIVETSLVAVLAAGVIVVIVTPRDSVDSIAIKEAFIRIAKEDSDNREAIEEFKRRNELALGDVRKCEGLLSEEKKSVDFFRGEAERTVCGVTWSSLERCIAISKDMEASLDDCKFWRVKCEDVLEN